MKLLLLEDNQILAETLEHFLRRASYNIDVALTMEEAEELTFANKYDLYLLDISLPQGSGLELLEALRNAEDNTPTIFITAMSGIAYLISALVLNALFGFYVYRLYYSPKNQGAMRLFAYSIIYLMLLFTFLLSDHFLYL